MAKQAGELSDQRMVDTEAIFTKGDSWDGGFFELRMIYDPEALSASTLLRSA